MNKELIQKRINQLNSIITNEYEFKLICWLNSPEPYNREIDLIAKNADYILQKIENYNKILNDCDAP